LTKTLIQWLLLTESSGGPSKKKKAYTNLHMAAYLSLLCSYLPTKETEAVKSTPLIGREKL
jgi:hypothetical protein